MNTEQTRRQLRIEVAPTGGRMVLLKDNYLRGWIEVDADGTITAYELDTSVASLKDRKPSAAARAGRAVADHLPGVHRAYVQLGTSFAKAIGNPAEIQARVAKCQAVGDNGGRCELLQFEGGDAWCGACGCPTALKRGCPKKKW